MLFSGIISCFLFLTLNTASKINSDLIVVRKKMGVGKVCEIKKSVWNSKLVWFDYSGKVFKFH